MYKIGDFSQLGQISVRMLRHYDQLGLLKPGYVDRFTNYRYYTDEQLPRLNRILALRDLGFSLEEIAAMLNEDLPVERLHSLLRAKQAAMEEEERLVRARLQRVAARLRHIEREGAPPRYEVATKSVAASDLLTVHAVVPTLDAMPAAREELLHTLYAGIEAVGVTPGTEMVLYHADSFIEHDIPMTMGALVEGPRRGNVLPTGLQLTPLPPAERVASLVHRSPLTEVADAISALYGWIGANGYGSTGPCRELHIFGRELDLCSNGTVETAVVVFELQVPIAPLA